MLVRGPRDTCGVSSVVDHCVCRPPPPPPPPPPVRRGGFGDPHFVTFADEHFSYQGTGVYSLVKGVYDGRPFEVQAYMCHCGGVYSGASCFVKVAVSLNTSTSECTEVLGPVTPASTCGGEELSFALDDWGSVELTADGVFVSLPESVRTSGGVSGLLVSGPTAGEVVGSSCDARSALQPVGGASVLFGSSDLDVAGCGVGEGVPVSCETVAGWLELPGCDVDTRPSAEAACMGAVSADARFGACVAEAAAWIEECMADYCAGLGARATCAVLEACDKTLVRRALSPCRHSIFFAHRGLRWDWRGSPACRCVLSSVDDIVLCS